MLHKSHNLFKKMLARAPTPRKKMSKNIFALFGPPRLVNQAHRMLKGKRFTVVELRQRSSLKKRAFPLRCRSSSSSTQRVLICTNPRNFEKRLLSLVQDTHETKEAQPQEKSLLQDVCETKEVQQPQEKKREQTVFEAMIGEMIESVLGAFVFVWTMAWILAFLFILFLIFMKVTDM